MEPPSDKVGWVCRLLSLAWERLRCPFVTSQKSKKKSQVYFAEFCTCPCSASSTVLQVRWELWHEITHAVLPKSTRSEKLQPDCCCCCCCPSFISAASFHFQDQCVCGHEGSALLELRAIDHQHLICSATSAFSSFSPRTSSACSPARPPAYLSACRPARLPITSRRNEEKIPY